MTKLSPSKKLLLHSRIPTFASCTSLIKSPAPISTAGSRNAALYFSDQWDPKYLSVLRVASIRGEMPLPGGMLYAPVGKGALYLLCVRLVPSGASSRRSWRAVSPVREHAERGQSYPVKRFSVID